MSPKRIIALFVALSLVIGLLSGCSFSTNIIGDISDPSECVTGFFEDLCNGRYGELDKYLYEQNLSISKATDEEDFNNVLLRQLQASYSYEILECGRESGLNGSCRVKFGCLDPNLLKEDLRSNATVIATKLVNAQNPDYTTDNNGVCELNDEGAKYSAVTALNQLFENSEKYYSSNVYDIKVCYINKSWHILLEDDLLKAISGYFFVD